MEASATNPARPSVNLAHEIADRLHVPVGRVNYYRKPTRFIEDWRGAGWYLNGEGKNRTDTFIQH